jgi:predicted nucleic acid-binding protein
VIVVDASIIVDVLLDQEPYSSLVADRLKKESPNLFAPHLLDAEVAQVLRRFVLRNEIQYNRVNSALDDLLALPIIRYLHTPLIKRAFDLRENVTIYDGIYLALAEGIGAPLLTGDQSLADVRGLNVKVEVIS